MSEEKGPFRLIINGISYQTAKDIAESWSGGSMMWHNGRAYPTTDANPCIIERLNASSIAEIDRLRAELATMTNDYFRRHRECGDMMEEVIRLRAEVDALREDASKTPDILFDGWSVLQALTGPAKKRTSPENVSDVLDAVVNILKAAPANASAKE